MSTGRTSAPILRRDVIVGSLFVVLWLVPLLHTAIAGYPTKGLQANVRDLYSVTCLFRHRTTELSLFYIQVRYADRRGYYDLDEVEYFPMQPFGHRSRFDRYMARFGHPKKADAQRLEVARFVADRHAQLHPDEAPIVSVRFIRAQHDIAEHYPPAGSWKKPPRNEVTRSSRVIGTYPLAEVEP